MGGFSWCGGIFFCFSIQKSATTKRWCFRLCPASSLAFKITGTCYKKDRRSMESADFCGLFGKRKKNADGSPDFDCDTAFIIADRCTDPIRLFLFK